MDEPLRAELLRRARSDQEAREAAADGDLTDEVVTALVEVDRANTEWLDAVVRDRGWPGSALVGDDGADAAWLLAQHADARPDLQRRWLVLLRAAAAEGEALPRHVAYLTDRVLLAEGGEQEYGTQLTDQGGRWLPTRLRDPDGVDARRAAVGLEPLEDYLSSSPDEGSDA